MNSTDVSSKLAVLSDFMGWLANLAPDVANLQWHDGPTVLGATELLARRIQALTSVRYTELLIWLGDNLDVGERDTLEFNLRQLKRRLEFIADPSLSRADAATYHAHVADTGAVTVRLIVSIQKRLLDWMELNGEPVEPKTPKRKRRASTSRETLTPKQLEAVQLYGECKGVFTAIAKRMAIDRKTAEQHVKAGLKKLGREVAKPITKQAKSDRRGQSTIADGDDRR